MLKKDVGKKPDLHVLVLSYTLSFYIYIGLERFFFFFLFLFGFRSESLISQWIIAFQKKKKNEPPHGKTNDFRYTDST